MERSSKRGKIPQHDWPAIISRYESGETLASIARTYDCSPPAISYIVSRTRARGTAAEATTPETAALPASEQPTVNAEALAGANDMADNVLPHCGDRPGGDKPLARQIDQSAPGQQPVNFPNPGERDWAADRQAGISEGAPGLWCESKRTNREATAYFWLRWWVPSDHGRDAVFAGCYSWRC